MKYYGQLQRRLHFLQIEFAIVAFIIGVHFIYRNTVGFPTHFTFLYTHIWDGSVLWTIIALWLVYIAYLCRAPSAALTVGGYISLAIAHFDPWHVTALGTYASPWAVCFAGLGIGLLGIGFWDRIKLDKAIKRESLPAMKVRQPSLVCGYELWQVLEWLLIIIGAGIFIIRIIISGILVIRVIS